jgi:hypothetical protein
MKPSIQTPVPSPKKKKKKGIVTCFKGSKIWGKSSDTYPNLLTTCAPISYACSNNSIHDSAKVKIKSAVQTIHEEISSYTSVTGSITSKLWSIIFWHQCSLGAFKLL